MKDLIDNANEEIKRADHMLHVTIKYTRSSGVVKDVIKEFIAIIDFSTEAILKKAKKNRKIKDLPLAILPRYELLEKIFPDNKYLKKLVKFYKLLKKINKSSYTVTEEYRKHLTINIGNFQLTVPMLDDYFERTKEYFKFAKEYVES